jgi:ABC-type lipoprotein export system ATPase subunit
LDVTVVRGELLLICGAVGSGMNTLLAVLAPDGL